MFSLTTERNRSTSAVTRKARSKVEEIHDDPRRKFYIPLVLHFTEDPVMDAETELMQNACCSRGTLC